ncbi:LysR family transcripitonal regulator [Pseudomonas aeruginosa VRFPA03]|nr:LysR family transcripitonal regulator [Pseudomonas aeruginosa VRFPA03]
MVSLDRFETFRAVVDCGSLSAAADTLGQTRAVVSFNLKRLEAELGVSLLSRSTRRMALTDAGERFYQRCVKVLDEARLAIDDARAEHGELRGSLRVTTTQEYGLRQLVPALQAFARLHPALQVQLSTSSLHADLIGERFDVAIRLGRLEDSTHHAVQLASFEVLAVASPACLAALGEPPPTDLESLERLQNLGHSRLAWVSPCCRTGWCRPTCAAARCNACWRTTGFRSRACMPFIRRPATCRRRSARSSTSSRLAWGTRTPVRKPRPPRLPAAASAQTWLSYPAASRRAPGAH